MVKLIRMLFAVLLAGTILFAVLYFFATIVNQEDSRIYVIPFNSVDQGAGDG